jgi:hypothetical protein
MHKVPIWHRTDLNDYPETPDGQKLYKYHCGINLDYLNNTYNAHGDPGINIGVAGIHKTRVYEDIDSNYKGKYYYPFILMQPIEGVHYGSVPDKPIIDIEPEHILNIKTGRCKILIVNTMEGWDHNSFFKILIDAIKSKYFLKYNDFVILSGNMEETQYGTPTVYHNWWEQHLREHDLGELLEQGVLSMNNWERPHKFICLNRRPHAHRIAITTLLHNYKHKGILTLAKKVDNNTEVFDKNLKLMNEYYPGLTAKPKAMNRLLKDLPLEYNDGVDPNTENPVHDDAPDKFYMSYLHVVTETFGRGSQTFFSEKVFKPIIYFQPFVLVGAYNDLHRLKSLGYKTFNGIIDESYDDIKDDEKRLIVLSKEIGRIVSMSNDEINNFYQSCYDIMMHNFFHWIYRQQTIHIDLKNNLLRKLNG